ncbi:MAG: hypothetical protein WA395_13630 [Nitrososphaeraceae archaeon]
MAQIKVEILLPLYYNDKREIEDRKFEETHDLIKKQFGGLTIADRPLLGYWIDQDTDMSYDNEKTRYIGYYVRKQNTIFSFLKS